MNFPTMMIFPSVRLISTPAKLGFIQLKRSTSYALALDRMPPEEMRGVLKYILCGEAVEQPHGGIGADALALERQHAATNPVDFKGKGFCDAGQRGAETSGQHLGSLDAIDPPQGEQHAAEGLGGIAAGGGSGGAQVQVSPVGPLGKNEVPVFEIRIRLNVESQFIGR